VEVILNMNPGVQMISLKPGQKIILPPQPFPTVR